MGVVIQPQVEAEVRHQIDRRLLAKGWILDPSVPHRNVFLERAVLPHLSHIHQQKLGGKSPDYTLFGDGMPLAVLEAKKPAVSIHDALKQGYDYADRIGIDFVFACNGPTFKTLHVPTGAPLYLNNIEVSEFLAPSELKNFRSAKSNKLITIPDKVINSREQLIDIFAKLNDTLRSNGVSFGLERFTEFANILFLKLLSERDNTNSIWPELLHKNEDDLPNYLNGFAIERLKSDYDSDVISKTEIDGKALKEIIRELNPLRLSSVDEDIKGVAFEHFLRRTTSVQNDLGEYFTPRNVVRFMVRLLNPQFGKTVFDPFCGTGGFLTEAFRHLAQQTPMSRDASEQLHKKSLYGREITKNARIAKMNMILFGDGHSGIEQGSSLDPSAVDEYDYVLSNIPFSLKSSLDVVRAVDPMANDSDEACLLKCFNSLHQGGSMAVVVPDGLVVNQGHRTLWQHLCRESRIRTIASLPRGTFAPYTDAATRVVHLTDKGMKRTNWYYDVNLGGGADSVSMEEFEFFHHATEDPLPNPPSGVDVVKVENHESSTHFYIERPWKVDEDVETVPLHEIATLRNGTSITKDTALEGEFPVIAGGRGTVPYTHNQSNAKGGCFTISKSGAYSGYVWWHETSIWASDSIVVRSRNEDEFISFYIYLCMKAKQEEIYSRQQGTGQPHVYATHIKGFPIPCLSLQDQKKIVDGAHDAVAQRLDAEKQEQAAVSEAISELGDIYDRKNRGGEEQ